MIRGWSLLRLWITLSCAWIGLVAIVGAGQSLFHVSGRSTQLVQQAPQANLCEAGPSAPGCQTKLRPPSNVASDVAAGETAAPVSMMSYVSAALLGPAVLLIIWMIYGWVVSGMHKHRPHRFLDQP